ncbi:MAG: glycosyltransferase family 9 protein [Candidatus Omnitrophica bacterium]|nr:glycosyltransferase family 9 protein [Candidatus Omnitrophota bacterium]
MKKILAFRNDRFGEFLLNIPAFRAIKEIYPEIELHVVVAPSVEGIAGSVPFIDKVLVRPSGPCPWWEDMALIGGLRREKYDAAVVLNPSREAHQIIFWARIPVRVGYSRKHHFLLTKTLEDHKHLGLHHEVDNNLDLVKLLGASTADKTLQLNIPADVKAAVVKKFSLDPHEAMVAVHPWTSDPVKQWPLERFKELVDGLAKDFPGKILIIGKPEPWHDESAFPSPLWGGVGEGGCSRIIDLRGKTSLLEAAAALSFCRCLASCDSGPMHLASAVGTPVVALFRNDMPGKNPKRWGPWGEGHIVIQQASMDAITVDNVLLVLKSKLG